jgi:hypothetical protein
MQAVVLSIDFGCGAVRVILYKLAPGAYRVGNVFIRIRTGIGFEPFLDLVAGSALVMRGKGTRNGTAPRHFLAGPADLGISARTTFLGCLSLRACARACASLHNPRTGTPKQGPLHSRPF